MALIDKASLLMVPSTYEDGTLYNVLPSGNRAPDSTDQNSGYDQTRADFTFDRGNNLAATRIDENGLIQKGRENLLLQSNSFDTTWTNIRSSESSGESGYDGTNDAWKFKDSTDSGTHRLDQVVTLTNSAVYSFSIYAKEGEHDTLGVEIGNTSLATNYVLFDLSDGTTSETGSIIDSSMTDIGNGWYRCSMTALAGSSDRLCMQVQTGSTASYTGNGTDGVLIQNAQLETGLVATDVMTSGSTTAKAGVLEDMPRISYDANGQNGALLLEGLRSNVLAYSEYFNASGVWLPNTITITDNYGTSPEGVQNSTRLVLANLTASRIAYAPSLTNGTTYTFSCYYKGTAGEKLYMEGNGSGGSGTQTSKLITFTGEWQREDLQFVGGSSSNLIYIVDSRNGTEDTAQDFEVYGAMLEAASYPSSYIPTHGSAVSRSAETITSGTITAPLSGGYTAFIEVETLSTSDYNQIQFRETAANYVLRIGNQVNVGAGSLVQNNTTGMNKFALQVSSGGAFELFKNGSSVGTGTGITHDIELIKTDLAGQNVKQVIVFDEALTDAECITLTTL